MGSGRGAAQDHNGDRDEDEKWLALTLRAWQRSPIALL